MQRFYPRYVGLNMGYFGDVVDFYFRRRQMKTTRVTASVSSHDASPSILRLTAIPQAIDSVSAQTRSAVVVHCPGAPTIAPT
jgi:hypothetical protein